MYVLYKEGVKIGLKFDTTWFRFVELKVVGEVNKRGRKAETNENIAIAPTNKVHLTRFTCYNLPAART